jgi:hypothetical protein
MIDDRKQEPESSETGTEKKRPYKAPVLTRYGSVEELVDSGVVGSVPSITVILV